MKRCGSIRQTITVGDGVILIRTIWCPSILGETHPAHDHAVIVAEWPQALLLNSALERHVQDGLGSRQRRSVQRLDR